MKSSCISHPPDEPIAMVHKWQLDFCDDNQCAAFLLSNFEHWHIWKLKTDSYNQKLNDIAQQHGESRRLSEDVWLFKSTQGLSDSILNLFGIKTINDALKLLERKGVISIHACPNKNHYYDRRKYFRFYPDICNEWLKTYCTGQIKINEQKKQGGTVKVPSPSGNFTDTPQIQPVLKENVSPTRMNTDSAKVPSPFCKNTDTLGKNTLTINELNINKNKSIIKADDFISEENELCKFNDGDITEVKPIIDALTEQGFPAERFQHPDAVGILQRLLKAGATTDMFGVAHSAALNTTQKTGRNFGLPYLAKVVENLITQSKKQNVIKTVLKTNYPEKEEFSNIDRTEDFKNALHWMGDLLIGEGK
jgi:hypothetical protein